MLKRTSLAGAAIVACAIVASSAAAGGRGAAATAFNVRSTLDGRNILPLRLRWLAYPTLPATQVKSVDFLIDGKLRWVEHSKPYVYGSDDNGRNQGFLITTWLTAGKHRFTARVTDTHGRRVSDTVVARVLPAPIPPGELAATWKRTVTADDIKKSGPEPPPAGLWKLIFDRVGAWHLDPLGSGVVNQYDAQPGVIHVYAPIWMGPKGISRFGHKGIGGNDCTTAGPFGTYRWAVSGNELTLTATHEACPNRRAVWEGVWTRVK